MFQAKALYDFQGEPNTHELNLQAGDVVTVLKTDCMGGWWEVRNASDQIGLIPGAYVETIGKESTQNTDWNAAPQPAATEQKDEWYDDWDDDTYSEIGPSEPHEQQTHDPIYANSGETEYNHFEPGYDPKGTVSKKSLNRFGSFMKNGGENYLLGNVKVTVPDTSKIYIQISEENQFQWPELNLVQTVQITSPKKESKLKGLKSYIAYQLTPSATNIQVSRRYKHFDWLHERLMEKFSLLAIPPLPDKQISGRYEEQFIERRRCQLNEFINYVCRHPVLSRCDVWQHFLTCTDEKLWKQGKRLAEKDELVNANFALCIEAPQKTLLPSVYETLESTKVPFIMQLDNNFKNTLAVLLDQGKKFKGLYGKEYQKVGNTFFALGAAIEYDSKAVPCHLSQNIKRMGSAYVDISGYYDAQPALDWDCLGDKLYLYKGITSSFQQIFSTCRSLQNKRKEIEKIQSGNVVTEVKARSDTFTYVTLAELKHFKDERDHQLKASMMHFLEEQVKFHQKIAARLQNVLDDFKRK